MAFLSLDQIRNQSGAGSFTPGAELLNLNRRYLANIDSILNSTGGAGSGAFIGSRPDLFQPSGAEIPLIQAMVDRSMADTGASQFTGQVSPAEWRAFLDKHAIAYDSPLDKHLQANKEYARVGYGASDPAAAWNGLLEQIRGAGRSIGSMADNFERDYVTGKRPEDLITSNEREGLDVLRGQMNVDDLINAYKGYFDTFITPGIKNNVTLTGQSGGSALPEFQSQWLARMAPVIQGQSRDAAARFGGAQLATGNTLFGRLMNNLNAVNSMRTLQGNLGVQAGGLQMQGAQTGALLNTIGMNNLGQGLNAAGLGRRGALTNYLTDMNSVNSMLGRIPVTNYGSGTNSASTVIPSNFWETAGMGLGLVNAGAKAIPAIKDIGSAVSGLFSSGPSTGGFTPIVDSGIPEAGNVADSGLLEWL